MEALILDVQSHINHIELSQSTPYSLVIVNDGQTHLLSNMDQNTQFEIGSLTKAFGAYLVKEYVKQGQASWNDTIQKWIPLKSNLTLLDALNHQNEYPEAVLTEFLDMGVPRERLFTNN